MEEKRSIQDDIDSKPLGTVRLGSKDVVLPVLNHPEKAFAFYGRHGKDMRNLQEKIDACKEDAKKKLEDKGEEVTDDTRILLPLNFYYEVGQDWYMMVKDYIGICLGTDKLKEIVDDEKLTLDQIGVAARLIYVGGLPFSQLWGAFFHSTTSKDSSVSPSQNGEADPTLSKQPQETGARGSSSSG